MSAHQSALRLALVTLFASTLAACGGGSSDASAVGSSPQPPGTDQPAGGNAGTPVDGSQPGGDTDPATPGGSTDAGSTGTAFGKGLRDRMLTTLAGNAQLSCDNGASSPSVVLDANHFQFGAVSRPLNALTKFVVGQIPESAPLDGTLAGDQSRIQLRFDDAGGPASYDLRFDPSGQLADVVVGTPNTNDMARDRVWLDVTSYCKPQTGQAWNAIAGLKVPPAASYALISERKAHRAASTLTCRTPAGVNPEQWMASIWVEDSVVWSTPRTSRPGDANYRYAPDEHLSHYTVIDGDFDVTEWDRLVMGGQWWGYSLTLGQSESIIAMTVDNRAGAPSTQSCETD